VFRSSLLPSGPLMRVEAESSEPVSSDTVARAATLARDFWPEAEIAGMLPAEAAAVPEPARSLLDHRSHMTVAMERFHGTEVRLRVAATVDRPDMPGAWYAREILLEKPDGTVVQYGIVRIDLGAVDAETARTIRAGRRPLGRILIDAGVLRDVQAVALLAIHPGPHLAGLIGLPPLVPADTRVYGRVADILLNGRPAVQLLEIVVPAQRR